MFLLLTWSNDAGAHIGLLLTSLLLRQLLFLSFDPIMGIYKEVGRKSLDEIVKMALFEKATPQAVCLIYATVPFRLAPCSESHLD